MGQPGIELTTFGLQVQDLIHLATKQLGKLSVFFCIYLLLRAYAWAHSTASPCHFLPLPPSSVRMYFCRGCRHFERRYPVINPVFHAGSSCFPWLSAVHLSARRFTYRPNTSQKRAITRRCATRSFWYFRMILLHRLSIRTASLVKIGSAVFEI